MPHIELLDIATANRIAAGEVVERPASIAKELIENSLDAGAKAITVEIRDGGIEYLRVTDNGSGIPAGEVRIAFERHATSKIRSGDLLDSIDTLGFRGEALPSIASVSRVELTSRQAGQESGMRIKVEGGQVLDLREAGCPEGTTFVVRELFYNTPARRKFLKRPTTEGGYVGDAVLQLALSRPDVSFRMVNNGRSVFHTPGNGEFMDTVKVLFGREIGSQLVPVKGSSGGMSISGTVGLQDAARANRQHEYFFINGRFVRSALLAQSLEEACKGKIAIGKYPFAVLYVSVPPDSIDVNVHPNKLEIRFRDEPLARQAVMGIMEDALAPSSAQPKVPLFAPPPAREQMRPPATVSGATDPCSQFAPPVMPAPVPAAPKEELLAAPAPTTPKEELFAPPAPVQTRVAETVELPPVKPIPVAETPNVQSPAPKPIPTPEPEPIAMEMPLAKAPPRLMGTLFATYLLVQQEDEFFMIDQHAAHERLLYEQLMVAMEQGGHSQSLLVPYSFTVTPAEKGKLLENMELLTMMGFTLSEFGETAYRVDAVPHILGQAQTRDFFIELLDKIDTVSQIRTSEMKRDTIATMACKKAVKGGDVLSRQELEGLLTMVMDESTPLTCPHGRPILLRMTRTELEKRFRRIQ